jgi:hypothetical protein
MISTCLAFLITLAGAPIGDTPKSLGLVAPAEAKGEKKAPQPYFPKEGDLIFFDDHNPIWTALFLWAGTGPPLHVGIVVKKKDGTLAVLEAGPDDTIWVSIQDIDKRLPKFLEDYDGTITIRRCKKALTEEKSADLTKYALEQDGKRYAILRLLIQGTKFRFRGPIRELFLARTDLDQSTWICSELVVAAGTMVGLFSNNVKSNVTYPLDLVNDHRHNLSGTWHPAEIWQPARE